MHYCLDCEPLWEMIGKASHRDLSSLIPKLGSDDCVSVSGLKHFACAFNIYHVLIKQHPEVVQLAADNLNLLASLDIASKVAKASISEWSERPCSSLASA